jgi:hypothetical protein
VLDAFPQTIEQAIGAALVIVVTSICGYFFGRRSNGRPR